MNAGASRPMRIVLIDDEEGILQLLSRTLRQKGYEVETYRSADERLAAVRDGCPCTACPDVILTDIDMPGTNGVDYLNLLHSRNCACRRIAVMTGSALEDTRLREIEKGGIKLFRKPFSVAEFLGWLAVTDRMTRTYWPADLLPGATQTP